MNTHTIETGRRTDRRGMTMIEVLIATLVFGTIMAGALGFMAAQNRAFNRGSERMTVLQNLRYAISTLETNLQTLGTNLSADQPAMVFAGNDVVAFNADYATNIANDPSAVFRELDAPDSEVLSLNQSEYIPNGNGYAYGDTTYGSGGIRGPAETVMLYLTPDTATDRDDDYMLLRKVNRAEPEVVARNLLQSGSTPFFRYWAERNYPSDPADVDSLADSVLPLRHYEPRSDSIRAVRVTIAATNGLEGQGERTAEMSRVIRMPNAGIDKRKVCGDEPIFTETVNAAAGTTPGGDPAIDLSWNKATDEGGGESDVIRYVLWRQENGAPDWGGPLLSLPAGASGGGYVYQDAGVESGTTYRYQVAAQDCTPSLSSPSVSDWVTVP